MTSHVNNTCTCDPIQPANLYFLMMLQVVIAQGGSSSTLSASEAAPQLQSAGGAATGSEDARMGSVTAT